MLAPPGSLPPAPTAASGLTRSQPHLQAFPVQGTGEKRLWRWQQGSISALLLKAPRGLDPDLAARLVWCCRSSPELQEHPPPPRPLSPARVPWDRQCCQQRFQPAALALPQHRGSPPVTVTAAHRGTRSRTCSHRCWSGAAASCVLDTRTRAECPSGLPQGQFLCLAIRDGKLVLYYDFSTGLEMAKPSSNSSLTISSTTNKAVRGHGHPPAPHPAGRGHPDTWFGKVGGNREKFFGQSHEPGHPVLPSLLDITGSG